MINARAETAAEKPAFRSAFRRRRCLVVADGFYEWQKTSTKSKQPFLIHLHDHRPFAFAGLWESWPGQAEVAQERISTCTILTTTPNDLMAAIHDRMPVILNPEDYDRWLDPQVQQPAEVQTLLSPYSGDDLVADAVSIHVNRPANDDPQCVARIEEGQRMEKGDPTNFNEREYECT